MYFDASSSIRTGWLVYELCQNSLFYFRTIKTLGFTHPRGDNQTLLGLGECIATESKVSLQSPKDQSQIEILSEIKTPFTPPNTEIICVQNVGIKVVCKIFFDRKIKLC